MTKDVSLAALDPDSLLDLKRTGACEFEIPEWFFDLDHPGHYLRRIRSVGVSIPMVSGPYRSGGGTITLVSSSIRVDAGSAHGYGRSALRPAEDRRFVDIGRASQGTVKSQDEIHGGLIEANLAHERYLPFENHGVASRWRVTLIRSDGAVLFSVEDFILHLRYTARDGGPALRRGAREAAAERRRIDPIDSWPP